MLHSRWTGVVAGERATPGALFLRLRARAFACAVVRARVCCMFTFGHVDGQTAGRLVKAHRLAGQCEPRNGFPWLIRVGCPPVLPCCTGLPLGIHPESGLRLLLLLPLRLLWQSPDCPLYLSFGAVSPQQIPGSTGGFYLTLGEQSHTHLASRPRPTPSRMKTHVVMCGAGLHDGGGEWRP